MIKLEDVTKSYNIGNRELSILKNINIDIQPGEFISIIGPSGSGKSTLLHVMGTLDRPTSGRILIGDRDAAQMDDNQLARVRNETIGFVFQNFHLLNYYTAIDNVCLPLIYSENATQSKSLGFDLLKHVGLENRIHHKPNELSGGERQRVAIARALINKPKILFADEPTGNLDSKSGAVVMDYLKEINQQGTTVILITHDSNIARLAHRIIHIQDGTIQ